MSDNIKKSEIIEDDILKNFIDQNNTLLKVLEKNDEKLKSFANTLTEVSKVEKTSLATIHQINTAYEKSKTAVEDKTKVYEEASKISEQLRKAEERLKLIEEGRTKELEIAKNAIREKNKELKNEIKETEAASGSINKLTAQNANLRAEVRKLDLTTEAGRKKAAEYNKVINKNTEIIKENSDKRLQQSMSVGNYTEAVKDALSETGIFNAHTQKMTQVFRTATSVIKGGTTATNGFKGALVGLGLGLLIVVLGSVVVFLSRFQKGIDLVADSMKGLGAFTDVFLDALAKLGGQIVDSVIPTLKGLKEAIFGIATLDFDRMTNGFNDVSDAVSGIDPLNMTKLAKEAKEAAKEAFNLSGALRAVEQSEKRFGLVLSQNNLKKKEALFYAKDESLSVEERLKFLKEAERLTIEEGNQALFFAKAKLDLAIENAKLAENQEEAWQELSELEAEYYNVQAKVFEERKTFQRDILRLLREEQKIKEDLRKKEEEAEKLLRDARVRNMIDEVNRKIQIEKNAYTDRLNELRRQGLLSNELEIELKKEHDRKILELEAERTQKTLEEIDKRTVQNVPEVTTDGIVDSEAEALAQRQKMYEDFSNFVQNQAQAITSTWTSQLDIAARQQQQIQQQSIAQFNALSQAAASGNIQASESLKEYQDKANEAQKRQIQLEKQKQNVQLASTAIQLFTSQIAAGKSPIEATAGVGTFLTVLKGIMSSAGGFFHGTESFGDSDGVRLWNRNKDTHLAAVNIGERIVPTYINSQIKDIPNEMLPQLINKALVGDGSTVNVINSDNSDLVNEIKGLRKDFKALPNSNYQLEETMAGFFSLLVQRSNGNTKTVNKYKS